MRGKAPIQSSTPFLQSPEEVVPKVTNTGRVVSSPMT